jgi:hypothetical protein
MRLYYEYITTLLSGESGHIFNGPLADSVPVAIINYRHELLYIPRAIAKTKFPNIQLWRLHKSGGHFAALEKPIDYVKDIEDFLMILKTK